MTGQSMFVARRRGVVCVGVTAALSLLAFQPADAVTYSHTNLHPEIQMYSYPAASASGAGSVRDRAPKFGAFSGLGEDLNPVFFPGTGLDPSRRGSFVAIANTSSNGPAGLDPSRYQINSLRVKTTLLGSLIYQPLNYVLPYDGTLDDSVSLTTGGNDDPGHPIEMYGIGFQGDYEQARFNSADSDAKFFQLGDPRWKTYQPGDPEYNPANPDAVSPYQYYAVDANGKDAENAVFGGYSATEPSGVTAQFTPTPFAIGKLYDAQNVEIAPGTLMKNGDVFTFEPNLSVPCIVRYLQSSLALGYLGFSFSSLHQPAGHEGTVPYPDFYLDDLDIGTNPNGAAPQFELSVTVLDPVVVGDYDRDGDVDSADYGVWRNQLGSNASTPGAGADGNGDGVVNATGYVVWRKHLSPGSGAGLGNGTNVSVPEPAAAALVGLAVVWLGCGRCVGRGRVSRRKG